MLCARLVGRAARVCDRPAIRTRRTRLMSMAGVAGSAGDVPAGGSAGGGAISWKNDLFGGAIVDSAACTQPAVFAPALKEAVKKWKLQQLRGIWLKLLKEQAALVPCAVDAGFEFHHAEQGYVMMTLWLPAEQSTLPPNASHQVGVGAFVLNDAGQMLVVQECKGPLKGRGVWKMPTGLLHAGEDISEAVEREVLEETGIRARFETVLALRHAHGFAFGKSDMFVLCGLRLQAGDQHIAIQEDEIEAARWLPLPEYIAQDTFKAPLYAAMSERMLAYAQGQNLGMQSAKLPAYTPISGREREDVLIWAHDVNMAAL